MEIDYLIIAVLFICIAHMIRVMRWELFIKIYEKPRHRNLINSLSVGYVLNYIIPYKLGDGVRALVSGRKMQNGKTLGLSTVIVDRYLDIMSVGIIFIVLALNGIGGTTIRETAFFYIAIVVILFTITIVVFIFRRTVKKVLRVIAGIFNNHIEVIILQFTWALIWNFKDIFLKINKVKMVLTTISMWLFYIVSYYFFAAFLSSLGTGISWIDIFTMFFAENGIKASTGSMFFNNNHFLSYPLYMAIYLLAPLLLMLLLGLFFKEEEEKHEKEYLHLFPHLDSKERLKFLENYFSGDNREYISNYIKINQSISIIKDYSSGSNATTMLCMDGNNTFFRKYAFGEDCEKLYEQILWIEDSKDKLKLPEILGWEKMDTYCYYDMQYNSNSVSFFEYVHSMPIENSWGIIQSILKCLENSIYLSGIRDADRMTIHSYVEQKVKKNLKKIKNAKMIRSLQQYDTIIINGVEYKNLSCFEKYLNENFLSKVFENDTYSVIHGDLTIENIICKRDKNGNDDFYIIDPNTGNVHDSPNLDYAKLLQSIHGGYEFLMFIKDIEISSNKINFMFTRSSAYISLHTFLKEYMVKNFGYERTRSIYFHEVIHWIRLLSHKVEKEGGGGKEFFCFMPV